ncbi:ribose-5-phosphate isomerase RpiA [Halodesulfurarchaeum sp. HSR-GB]|uniref:ribose-5-phosphate isomerase RpiA n=1 Tax=Halodesulfurarchaeum sp. HSR-GB TaxID=3074077 RepID=UPI002859C1EC|nr:ribose-5-phosphate isomerase RpiA [Halodesulfurarchaeum sp. HSR-GB]MDR5656220.1 ribose-5-phosphate isomerase RpiA [Halodesulfurarchaeum sp. HSR-GB]
MSDGGTRAARKRRAGERAVEMVTAGDVVGLGTGSTAAYAIEALGEAVEQGLEIEGIPTSYQSRALALEAGIPLTALDAVDGIDIAIDGADQVVEGQLIKGGGAAHAQEKIVDAAADRFVVVVDDGKLAAELTHPVPVEVVPEARPTAMAAISDLGGEPTLRDAGRKDGPVITQHGNVVLDVDFGRISDPAALGASLASVPGVLEHGLFVDLADEIVVGGPDAVRVLETN